jgi:hypothetical protein
VVTSENYGRGSASERLRPGAGSQPPNAAVIEDMTIKLRRGGAMGAQPPPNSARLLAPVALAVCAIAFFAVILSNGSGDAQKGKQASATSGKRSSTTTRKTKSRTPTRSTYTVKIGDNLPAIAKKTGVSVEKIQELNPQMDPYGLQGGQKIKLRE